MRLMKRKIRMNKPIDETNTQYNIIIQITHVSIAFDWATIHRPIINQLWKYRNANTNKIHYTQYDAHNDEPFGESNF